MILCFTNKTKDTYTSLFKIKYQKYYCKQKTIINDITLYNGSIFVPEEPITKVPSSLEIRHAFTVHSIQGETVKNNLYIDIKNMNNQMIYTAISRCEHIDKCYII